MNTAKYSSENSEIVKLETGGVQTSFKNIFSRLMSDVSTRRSSVSGNATVLAVSFIRRSMPKRYRQSEVL